MKNFNTKTALKDCKTGAIFVAKYYLWLIVLLFICDIVSKNVMEHILKNTNGSSIVVIPHFISFTLVYNTGAGWGMFAGMSWLLISCSVICGLAMLFLFIYKGQKIPKLPRVALSLMIPGAFGNLIDRAFYPHGVIDFLEFTFMDFPVFNMADSYLVIGIVLLIIWYILAEINDVKKKKAEQNVTDNEINLVDAANKLKKEKEVSSSDVETKETEEKVDDGK